MLREVEAIVTIVKIGGEIQKKVCRWRSELIQYLVFPGRGRRQVEWIVAGESDIWGFGILVLERYNHVAANRKRLTTT